MLVYNADYVSYFAVFYLKCNVQAGIDAVLTCPLVFDICNKILHS